MVRQIVQITYECEGCHRQWASEVVARQCEDSTPPLLAEGDVVIWRGHRGAECSLVYDRVAQVVISITRGVPRHTVTYHLGKQHSVYASDLIAPRAGYVTLAGRVGYPGLHEERLEVVLPQDDGLQAIVRRLQAAGLGLHERVVALYRALRDLQYGRTWTRHLPGERDTGQPVWRITPDQALVLTFLTREPTDAECLILIGGREVSHEQAGRPRAGLRAAFEHNHYRDWAGLADFDLNRAFRLLAHADEATLIAAVRAYRRQLLAGTAVYGSPATLKALCPLEEQRARGMWPAAVLAWVKAQNITGSGATRLRRVYEAVIAAGERQHMDGQGDYFHLWPDKQILAVLAGKGGVGKCLTAETEIIDPRTGLIHTIQQVVESPAPSYVVTLQDRSRIGTTLISDKIYSGMKRCVRIVLASGRSITATPSHPFLTPGGWRAAQHLTIGATIALPARLPEPLEPSPLRDAEVDILAILLAEGNCTGQAVRFTTTDSEIVARAQSAAAELGMQVAPITGRHIAYDLRGKTDGRSIPLGLCQCGCGQTTKLETRTYRHPPDGKVKIKGVPRRFAKGHKPRSVARVFMERFGLAGKKSTAKTIPNPIFRVPNAQLARFLSIFWMCDGYVGAREPEIALGSQCMVRQIQHLLLRLGVQSRVSYKPVIYKGRTFDSWRLRVYSQSIPQFAAAIALWGEKARRLQQLADRQVTNPNTGAPRVDTALQQELRTVVAAAPHIALKSIGVQIGRNKGKFQFDSLFNQKTGTLSMTAFRAFCQSFIVQDRYRLLLSQDVFWDRIISIEDAGEHAVFDLGVPETHCFVANDIIVHNSTVTRDLAYGLTAAGRRVLVIDADFYGPSQPLLFPTADPRLRTHAGKIVPHRVDGIEVVSLGHLLGEQEALTWRGIFLEPVLHLLAEHIESDADVVLIDMPPGTGDMLRAVSSLCPQARFLVVATAGELARADVRRAVFALSGAERARIVGLVDNMAYRHLDNGQRIALWGDPGDVPALARECHLRFLGALPMAPAAERMPVVQALLVPPVLAALDGTPTQVVDPQVIVAAADRLLAEEQARMPGVLQPQWGLDNLASFLEAPIRAAGGDPHDRRYKKVLQRELRRVWQAIGTCVLTSAGAVLDTWWAPLAREQQPNEQAGRC